jgi:Protein of unknown function (DUF2510)
MGENEPHPDAPGWYADPDDASSRRYWDGQEWGARWGDQDLAPEPSEPLDTRVIIGWIASLVIPIVGLVLGIVWIARGQVRNGGVALLLAVVAGAIIASRVI